ncbi:MAG TPA: hypothetical protein VJM81_03610 [Rhizorhapis sp.]|nr:hypothetical protein [Rhizorhapis sp.]
MIIIGGRAAKWGAGPVLAGCLLIGSELHAVDGRQANFLLVELTHPFVADTPIGPRKAGLMCLPNGKVRWGDINTGTSDDLRAILAERLNAIGLPPRSGLGRDDMIPLRARIISLTVSACAKKFGLGQPGALTGKGIIETEWVGSTRSFVTRANFSFQPTRDTQAPVLSAAFRETALLVIQELAGSSTL